jgi:alkaline phosphatase
MKTHSYDNLVTDSAAGGTAMACGVKTYNNGVGVDKDGIPVKSILEEAEEKEMMTGIVVTSALVNATPASFMAHQKLRAFTEPIAEEIANSGVDFLVGGGKKYFDRRDSDERNLSKEMEDKGYQVEDFIRNQRIQDVKINPGKKFVYFTADDDPLTKITGRDYLPHACKMGAEFLKANSENGFFMMIEGSQIDLGGHATNFKYVMSELKDFDESIKQVLKFAEEDGETLVVVTADHETGGLAIKEGSKLKKIKSDFIYGRHTGTMVPVFAYGPGSENFTGIFDNTELYRKMKVALAMDSRN